MPDAAPPDQDPPPRAPGSLFNDPEVTGEPAAPAPPPAGTRGWPQQQQQRPQPTYGAAPADGTGAQFVKPGAQPYVAPGQPYTPPQYGARPQYAAQPFAGPQFVKVGHEPPTGQPPAGSQGMLPPWSWWIGPFAVFAGFMSVIGAGIVVVAIATLFGASDLEDASDNLTEVLTLLQQVLWIGTALVVPYLIVRYLRPEHLGLAKTAIGRSVGIGFATLLAFYFLAAVYAAALGLDENSNELLNDTGFGESVSRDVILTAVFTIGAPVSEELLFRALLFGSLAAGFSRKLPRSGPYLAALISGVIFGAIHAGQGQDKYLPMLMALGVLLALAYYWSGTLYVPIVLHAINNAMATGLNSDPAADWIYAIIILAPVLSLLLAIGLARLVRARFRPEPPPRPPTFLEPGRPAGL